MVKTKERYDLYEKICIRAEEKIPSLKRWVTMMDIESADEVFNLRLEDWLNANDENFFHDIVGIVTEADRETFPATFGMFVPRFAGHKEGLYGVA